MRCSIAILLAGTLYAGKLAAQKVSLSVSSKPIDKVCKEIEKQTGYYFVYPKDLNEKAPLISVDLKDEPINSALTKVFEGLPVTYRVIDKVVAVNTVKKPASVVIKSSLADTIEVNGRVINRQAEPLQNATVVSMVTKRAIITNDRGFFKFKGVSEGEELMVTYAGYKPKKFKADKQMISLVMEVTEDDLDKVVVQAYGTTSRRLTTSNIGVITAKDIEEQPVTNPLMALQGRVAGLEILQSNGYASGPLKVEIRGRASISEDFTSDPLYIIDGVPLTVLDVSGTKRDVYRGGSLSRGFDQNSMSPAGGQSPLFGLNPADIESITVLKDADATAIYGSRGANGVILINTKRGKSGKNRFDVNASQGVSYVTRYWDMLKTSDYLAMRREAFKNDNTTPTAVTAPDLLLWDSTRYTDWQKYGYGGTGKWTNVQAALSGGNAQTTFRLAGSYNRTTDIATVTGSNQKAGLSFAIDNRSLNQKFKWSFTTGYTFSEVNLTSIGAISELPPNGPAVLDSSGNLNWKGWAASTGMSNLNNRNRPYDNKSKLLTSNLTLNYNIFTGLVARVSVGYNSGDVSQTSFIPISSQNPGITPKPTGTARFGTSRSTNWIVEPQLEYNGLIGIGKLNLLLGGTSQANSTSSITVTGVGYTNDALIRSISNAVTTTGIDYSGQYKYAGAFFRAGYNWENKYVLNLNARRDGSSRFGSGKQFGNFGSVGAAWILTEENWVRNNLPTVISFIKLRGSYGLTGSDAVGDYKYLSQWGNATPQLTAYNGVSPLAPQILENNGFHWQVNKKLEAAFDIGFLNDRINVEAAYYRNRCNNQLVSFPVPDFTGFSSVVANMPANVQNTGWEFVMDASAIQKKNFSWSTSFNISFNQNKLLSYPHIEQSPYYSTYRVGESLNNVYVLNYTGIDPLTGQRTFTDWNHDGKTTTSGGVGTGTGDRYVGVNRSPKYFGSFVNRFRYKSLQLTAVLAYKKQIGQNAVSAGAGAMSNISVWSYTHRWKGPGDTEAEAPRLTTNGSAPSDNAYQSSNGLWSDASFIRLQTVAFSYMVPAKIARKAGMSTLSFTVNAQNIFVLTNYLGIDPEVNNYQGMPPSRTITAGINCSF